MKYGGRGLGSTRRKLHDSNYIGKVQQYFLISVFAWLIELANLITSGASFQIFVASYTER